MEYEFKKLVCEIKIAKTSFRNHILSLDSPGYFTSSDSYMEDYNGEFKNGDTHYEEDWNQMETLAIHTIDDWYWLASRYVETKLTGNSFNVRVAHSTGYIMTNNFCSVYSYGGIISNNYSNSLRPVFHLKPNIKITGGSGTEDDPYTLGV